MNEMNILKEFTSMQLLRALIYKNGHDEAPIKTQRFVPHIETAISIGNDYTAYITMPEDAYKQLFQSDE